MSLNLKKCICIAFVHLLFLSSAIEARCVPTSLWQSLDSTFTSTCSAATGLCQGVAVKFYHVNGSMFVYPSVQRAFACENAEEAHYIAGLSANCSSQSTASNPIVGSRVTEGFDWTNGGHWTSWSVCLNLKQEVSGYGGHAVRDALCPIGYTISPPIGGQSDRTCRKPMPCPVEPLKPITDPDAIRFESGDNVRIDRLSANTRTRLQCLQNWIAQERPAGSLTVTSAWRPQAYQDHLREIVDKIALLNNDGNRQNQACAPIRRTIEAERVRHGLGTIVGRVSSHTAGNAFDATWANITTARIDVLAARCGLSRPIPNDTVHFQ